MSGLSWLSRILSILELINNFLNKFVRIMISNL